MKFHLKWRKVNLSTCIVYHEKIKTSRIFVRDCSLVPIYSMVLFGGYSVDIELQRGQFVLSMEDGWIKFVTFRYLQFQKCCRY